MALGNTRASVLRGFLLEGALLGLLGAALGLLAALGAGQLLDLAAIEMPPPPTFARSYHAALLITPVMMLEVLLIAVLTTTLASFYPAWRASRMEIVEAIRHVR
jgi:putative ABC transport system permease protein